MPKKEKLFFIFFIFFFCLPAFVSSAKVIDKILVVVNDEIITQGELDRITLPLYAQYKSLYAGRELEERIAEGQRNMVNKLIDNKLLLAEAKRKEVEVADEEVNLKIEEMKASFSTEKEFKEALARENILLSELEKRFKERMMVERVISLEMAARISVSPNEVLDYYKENPHEFTEREKVKARSILVRTGSEHSDEEARKLAEEILRRAKEGGEFSRLAAMYSEGPYADYGGDMGWVEQGKLIDEVNDTVFQLEEGELSGLVKTKLGFHIIKAEARVPGETKEFNDVKKRIEGFLFSKKKEKKLKGWLDELKENAYIEFK